MKNKIIGNHWAFLLSSIVFTGVNADGQENTVWVKIPEVVKKNQNEVKRKIISYVMEQTGKHEDWVVEEFQHHESEGCHDRYKIAEVVLNEFFEAFNGCSKKLSYSHDDDLALQNEKSSGSSLCQVRALPLRLAKKYNKEPFDVILELCKKFDEKAEKVLMKANEHDCTISEAERLIKANKAM